MHQQFQLPSKAGLVLGKVGKGSQEPAVTNLSLKATYRQRFYLTTAWLGLFLTLSTVTVNSCNFHFLHPLSPL